MSQQAAAFLVPDTEIEPADPSLLSRITECLEARELFDIYVYRGAQDWRVTFDDIDVLNKYERLRVDDLAKLCVERADALICASFQGPLVELVKSVVSEAPEPIRKWKPFLGQLRFGKHSIPDYEFEETAWSGNVSVAVYGNRMPEDPDELVGVLNENSGWTTYVSRLRDILGVPVLTKVEVSY